MPDVTTGLRLCRDRARVLGYRVEEVPGWESRGKGRLTPQIMVNHHDAIRGPSPTAGLRVCTYGRPGLENALCNTYGERGPGAGIWLVAAGVAWHAGQGEWGGVTGNSRALGRENANDGVGEPWHPDALEVQRVWDRVQAEVFGLAPAMYCEHKEYAPSRKPDRRGVSGDAWRRGLTETVIRVGQEEDIDVLLIRSKQTGTTVLVGGGTPASIHTADDVRSLISQGVKLAEVDEVMLKRLIDQRVY